jgi:hypothetical protein
MIAADGPLGETDVMRLAGRLAAALPPKVPAE